MSKPLPEFSLARKDYVVDSQMPESDGKVSRYCPSCGQRVSGSHAMFSEPQVCPKCKQRVLFYDYQIELPALDDDRGLVDAAKLRKFSKNAWIVAAGLLALALLALLIGVFTGVSGAVLVAALVGLGVGVAGFAVISDMRHKVSRLMDAYDEAGTRLAGAASKNTDLANRYQAMKVNFDAILEDVKKRREEEYLGWIGKAAADAQDADLRLLEILTLEEEVNGRVRKVVERFLRDTRRNIKSKLTVNNFAASRERFIKAVEFCRKNGCDVSKAEENEFLRELETDFKELVRAQASKERQAEMRQKVREEERVRRDLEREIKRAAAEQSLIRQAIEDALAKTQDEHSAEVELLRQKLAEAEEKGVRAKSMAQQTKAGNVYVISNIGSFGEEVFKIGMTRRLDPLDRVKELGDASVPFPFDVHMMIYSEDAPGLEAALHRRFNHQRVNRVNMRKEFFRVALEDIASAARAEAGEIEYVAEPEAFEYRESLMMTDEDVDTVAAVVDPEALAED